VLHHFQGVSSQGRPLLDCLDLRERKKAIYQSTLLHDTEGSPLHWHCCENFWSHTGFSL